MYGFFLSQCVNPPWLCCCEAQYMWLYLVHKNAFKLKKKKNDSYNTDSKADLKPLLHTTKPLK